jgi:hypothetical protein
MEHARLNNWRVAAEFFNVAFTSCPSDPLLNNELGVLYYEKEDYNAAIGHFQRVFESAQQTGTPLRIWGATLCNIGHAYRRMGNLKMAREYFDQALESDDSRESAYAALGLLSYQEEKLDLAIEFLHKALEINFQNRYCSEMLDSILTNLATLTINNPLPILKSTEFDNIDIQLAQKFARDGDNLDFPDLEDVQDPDNIILDSESDRTSSLLQAGMLTRGKLRGRKSNIFDQSPPSAPSLVPKRGMLVFQSSPPDPFDSKSPPRSAIKGLFPRDVGLDSDPGLDQPSFEDHVFNGPEFADEVDEMDLDEDSAED